MKVRQFGKAALVSGILLMVSLGGCMMPPQVNPPLGDSVREIMARQVANPAAADIPDDGTGMDGQAAKKTMETYRAGFNTKKKSGSTSITINQ